MWHVEGMVSQDRVYGEYVRYVLNMLLVMTSAVLRAMIELELNFVS